MVQEKKANRVKELESKLLFQVSNLVYPGFIENPNVRVFYGLNF